MEYKVLYFRFKPEPKNDIKKYFSKYLYTKTLKKHKNIYIGK